MDMGEGIKELIVGYLMWNILRIRLNVNVKYYGYQMMVGGWGIKKIPHLAFGTVELFNFD